MNYRTMSPQNALNQFKSLFRYTDRTKRFWAVDNIMPVSYVGEVFPNLNPPPGVTIGYEVKANLKETDIQTLAAAKVTVIQPGIEALSSASLRLIRKGATAFSNIQLLQLCRRYDVYPEWNLLLGLPGETEDVYEKYVRDIPKLYHLPPPRGVYPIRFDRYSPYFRDQAELQLQLDPVEFYSLVYPFPEDSLRRLAYYFYDKNASSDRYVRLVKWLAKVRSVFDQWWSRWYSGDRRVVPDLYFMNEAEEVRVYDSRRSVETSSLSQEAVALLAACECPRPIESLSELTGLAEDRVQSALAEARGLSLIFEENGRVLNLVQPHSSPWMSYNPVEHIY